MKFYLVAGANGSGKTTLAKEILGNMPDLYFLNSDEIAAELGDDLGIKSGKILLARFEKCLLEGRSIVLESTISGHHHFRILEKVRHAGYEIYFIYVFLDFMELNVSRVKNRVLLGGHDVPKNDISRRYYRSLQNFEKTKIVADKWELFHNVDNTFEKIAFGNEENNILNKESYNIFKELIKCGH